MAVIVLAAGLSRRFRGGNKLLRSLQGKPLLHYSIEAALAAAPAQLIVVTGFEAERIMQSLSGHPVQFVHNDDYNKGMGTSIAAGISALNDDIDGAFICLADMPLIEPQDFALLAKAYRPDTGRNICVPIKDGKRGHPVFFAREYFKALSSLKGHQGARQLLKSHPENVQTVRLPSSRKYTDIDTCEDLQIIQRYLSHIASRVFEAE